MRQSLTTSMSTSSTSATASQPCLDDPQQSPVGHGSDLLSVPGGVGIDQPTYKERFDPTKGWFVTEEIICHLDNRDAIPALQIATRVPPQPR